MIIPGLLGAITGWVRSHPRLAMAIALLALLLIILKFIDYQQRQIQRLQLEKANIVAALDSTRNITTQLRRQLRDHETAVQRLAVQKAERDSIDRELKQVRVFLGTVTADLAELWERVSAPVVRTKDTLRATFALDRAPHHVTVGVVAPDSGTAQADIRVRMDPITYGIRVGCGKAIEGVRPAQVTVIADSSMRLTLGQQTVDPDVCNRHSSGIVVGASTCSLKALRCPAVSPLLDIRTGRIDVALTLELTKWLRPGISYQLGN